MKKSVLGSVIRQRVEEPVEIYRRISQKTLEKMFFFHCRKCIKQKQGNSFQAFDS